MLWIHSTDHYPYGVELVTPFEPRKIVCAFHDIDGTHSKIREWVPAMTLVTGTVAAYGMFRGPPLEIAGVIRKHQQESFPESELFVVDPVSETAVSVFIKSEAELHLIFFY